MFDLEQIKGETFEALLHLTDLGLINLVEDRHKSLMENRTKNFETKKRTVVKRDSLSSSSRIFDIKLHTNVKRSKEAIPMPSALKNASDSRDGAFTVQNPRPVQCDVKEADRLKVKKTLQLFQEMYEKLTRDYMLRGRVKRSRRIDLEVAKHFEDNRISINQEKDFGHTPGVAIGDQFRFRAQLAVIGLHNQLVAGIDYMLYKGKKHAISIVDAGRYENTSLTNDVFIFCGHGGCEDFGERTDQKMERGNLALMYNIKNKIPVRVIKKRKIPKVHGTSPTNDCGRSVYIYDGLYRVVNCKQVIDQKGNILFKYELHRIPVHWELHHECRKLMSTRKECCLVRDISKGKENMPVPVVNGVDEEKPRGFTYIVSTKFPYWFKETRSHMGCNCTGSCPDSLQCFCTYKNGDCPPYNEKGLIIGPRPMIYECGPYCKCSSSCKNRVSQNGLRYKLEIYRTQSGEWGVRSKSFIPLGSFICEYAGILSLQYYDIEHGIDHNKANVYEMGFKIEASRTGNVARFIRNSKSPSAFVQRVLYDHGDKRMPRLMIFAAKNIPPLMEITYDYDDSNPSLT